MSSRVSEELSSSPNEPSRTTTNRPKLSLANEIFDTPTNLETTNSQAETAKRIEKLRTFIIWSIFNLLFIPFGILCCYFSYKVSQFKRQNRYEMANKWSKRTFVLNIMSTLLMVGVIITVYMLHYDYEQRNYVSSFNETRTTGAYIPWQPGR
jgi:heme/copper-type cytochrome/quinol oxidase subunit 1